MISPKPMAFPVWTDAKGQKSGEGGWMPSAMSGRGLMVPRLTTGASHTPASRAGTGRVGSDTGWLHRGGHGDPRGDVRVTTKPLPTDGPQLASRFDSCRCRCRSPIARAGSREEV